MNKSRIFFHAYEIQLREPRINPNVTIKTDADGNKEEVVKITDSLRNESGFFKLTDKIKIKKKDPLQSDSKTESLEIDPYNIFYDFFKNYLTSIRN